jgi:hypothetical protein
VVCKQQHMACTLEVCKISMWQYCRSTSKKDGAFLLGQLHAGHYAISSRSLTRTCSSESIYSTLCSAK